MWFQIRHAVLHTSVFVLLSVSYVSLACQSECQLSSWYPWQCTYCCVSRPVTNAAYREKSICCYNITDGQQCLDHCTRLGYNMTVIENGACTTHCPCGTTTTVTHLPTRIRVSTNSTGPSTSAYTRTRLALTTVSASGGTSQTSTDPTGLSQPNPEPNSQRNTGSDSCKDDQTKTADSYWETTAYYWMIPIFVLLTSVLGVQCYILYRMHKRGGKVQTIDAPGQQASNTRLELI